MPDLILYRRHHADCRGVRHGREFVKCKCPIWCDGRIDGKRVNHSMKTKDWDRAERRMLKSFDPGDPATKRQLLSDAVEAYLADCRARHLQESTITSYKNTLGDLQSFCEAAGAKHADQVTLDALTAFR